MRSSGGPSAFAGSSSAGALQSSPFARENVSIVTPKSDTLVVASGRAVSISMVTCTSGAAPTTSSSAATSGSATSQG